MATMANGRASTDQGFNSLLASDNFCHLLITFANNLSADQAQQSIRPDLDLNCLTLMVCLKELLENDD